MPRYHFDTQCGDLRCRDEDGIDLSSIQKAKEQLIALLRDLTYHDEADSYDVKISATVRCGASIVLHGSCCLTISTAESLPPRH